MRWTSGGEAEAARESARQAEEMLHAQHGAAQPLLLTLTGKSHGATHISLTFDAGQIARSGAVLGRSAKTATAVIQDEGVSREHARITVSPDGLEFTLEDLNSMNGTFVNGQRLSVGEGVVLGTGDEVCLGSVIFKVAIR